jgi:hypothetical protein
MASTTDAIRRSAPFVRGVIDDNEIHEQLTNAFDAARSALTRARSGKAAEPSTFKRAGEAVGALGAAIAAAGDVRRKQERHRGRRVLVGLALLAAGGYAAMRYAESAPAGGPA